MLQPSRVLSACIRFMKRHPALTIVVLFVYLAVAVSPFLIRFIANYQESVWDADYLRWRVYELEETVEKKDSIIDVLTKRIKVASFLRDIPFEEIWDTEENRTYLLRQFEYAKFATEKEDYAYAERIYRETLPIQNTLTARYYLGQLAYLQGDLQTAAVEWKKVIELDPQVYYAELLLYMGILMYELGDEKASLSYLEEYLAKTIQ